MFISVLLLVLSVLLPGCSSLHLTASPVFEATVQHLPNPGDTVAIFPSKRRNGAQDLARTEQEAITWIRDHGVIGLEKAEVDRMLREQRIPSTQVTDSAVLQAAYKLGASEVIFVEEDIGSISFRSVSVETGRVAWIASGTYADPCFDRAQYVFKCSRDKDSFGWNLVSRTLDAAWSRNGSEGNRRP